MANQKLQVIAADARPLAVAEDSRKVAIQTQMSNIFVLCLDPFLFHVAFEEDVFKNTNQKCGKFATLIFEVQEGACDRV